MNIQRLSESLYHIWSLRLQGVSQNTGYNTPDYIPDGLFSRVMYHTRLVEKELTSVHFNAALLRDFKNAVDTLRVRLPYIKTINTSGLFLVPLVGNTEERELRRAQMAKDAVSYELRKKFITLANEEFRNVF